MKNILLKTSVLLLLATQVAIAQRPKVGLSLSGGGAKGLAHIGVLKALDSAQVKVDYITGTSMGSIIGAMYAAGYSGNQIETISKKLNWDDILSGKTKYRDVRIDEKGEYDKYVVEIPFKGLKPYLGTGMIESEEIWLTFSEILFPIYDKKNFNDLNIPFKCVATDLSNGKAVVLDSGEIVKSLRSSMAIPSVFSAVPYKNTMLVDGGITRNFPVKDVKQMGADYVIGVNLFKGLPKGHELETALDVMYQITQYRDADDLEHEKKKCNILIEPPLDAYSAGSFSSADTIITIGNAIGKEYYPAFKHLADSLNQIEKIKYDPNSRLVLKEAVIIDEFEVIGLEKTTESMLLNNLGLEKGRSYTVENLSASFRNAYSTLFYQYVYYELEPLSPGHVKMRCIVSENPLTVVKLGLSYHTFSDASINVNFTKRNLIFDKSKTMFKVGISENYNFLFQHRQYFGKMLNHQLGVSQTFSNLVIPYNDEDLRTIATYDMVSMRSSINYQYIYKKNNIYGVDLRYDNFKYSPEVSSSNIDNGKKYNYGVDTYWNQNTLDRKFLPTSGVDNRVVLDVELDRNVKNEVLDPTVVEDPLLNGKLSNLYRLTFINRGYVPLTDRLTLQESFQGGLSYSDEESWYDYYFVGGNQQIFSRHMTFAGYKNAQIQTNSFSTFMLGLQHRVWSEFYVIVNANAGVTNVYHNDRWFDVNEMDFISGFSATAAYNIGVLPVEFTLNYTPDLNSFTTNVRIGYLF